jgi:hypothetical protein
MVHTLDRFNHDPHFANAFPSSEERTDNGYHFGVSLDYRPSATRIIQ